MKRILDTLKRKWPEYLLEIGVISFGILIALALNNWNQSRLNRAIERETLISLNVDLEAALDQLEEKIRQTIIFYDTDSSLLEIVHQRKITPNDSLEVLLFRHYFTPTFDPELGTLNEILYTGKMDLIKNKELRRHISSWNKYMDGLEEVEQMLLHFDREVKEPLYSKYLPYKNHLRTMYSSGNTMPLSNFNWNPEELIFSIEFENMLAQYMIFSSFQYDRFIELKDKIIEMKNLIDTELN